MKKTLILYFICISAVFGQMPDEKYLIEYKKAVQLFADSQYEAANTRLIPLTSKSYNNPVVPYSMYYYALSTKKLGQNYQSRVILRQLFERFPDWDKMEEAYLLYAEVNLSENYYEEGIKSLERIQDPQFKPAVTGLINTTIPPIKNVELLKDLYGKFPGQVVIAKTLVKRIQEKRVNTKADLELSDVLTNRFKLNAPSGSDSKEPKRGKSRNSDDNVIDFGVLLPFNIKEVGLGSNLKTNQYVYDLYAGMRLAAEELKAEGIDIKLFAFDVEKRKEDFVKLEKDPNFNKIDLFVGPLYPEPNNEAVEFAIRHKIFQVHPLSNNVSLLKDSKNIFLVQPSYTQQARRTLEFVKESNLNKNLSIYFGPSKKDSLFAFVYKTEAEKKGYKVLEIKKFVTFNSIKPGQAPGHVFFSGDNNLGVKFVQGLGQQKIKAKVICNSSAFNFEKVSPDILTRDINIIYPEFVDSEKKEVVDFNKKYLIKMGSVPSYFSYSGYDLVLYFARMLKDGKDIMSLNLDAKAYTEDFTLGGFDFRGNKNENEIVPIVKFEDGKFVEIFR